METISTSQLRTKSSDLIKTLTNGKSVMLIHRSRKVGTIKPEPSESDKLVLFDANKFGKLLGELDPPPVPKTDEERERKYREHLVKKYGYKP